MKYKSHKAALIGTVDELIRKTGSFGPIHVSADKDPSEMTPDECAEYINRVQEVYADALIALQEDNKNLKNEVEHYRRSYLFMVKDTRNDIHLTRIGDKIGEKMTKAKKAFIEYTERMKGGDNHEGT